MISNAFLRLKYRYLFPALSMLPRAISYPVASRLGYMEMSLQQEQASVIRAQMERALPHNNQLDHWTHHHFGLVNREILDSWYYPKMGDLDQIQKHVKVNNIQPLLDAHKAGRPIIITSGHYSRFWMVGVVMAAYGVPLGTLARDSMDENTYGLAENEYNYRKMKLQRLQKCYGGNFLVNNRGMRPLFRELEHNPVAILMDVPYGRSAAGLVDVEFFSHPARVADGISRIARKTNAMIQPYFITEDRSGLTLDFLPQITPVDDDKETMQQLMNLLESKIRQSPGQWYQWPALPMFWGEVE